MADLLQDPSWQALLDAQQRLRSRFPGEAGRQPAHVVYGGAHLFSAETPKKLGALARRALETFAPSGPELGEALGLSQNLAALVHARLVDKLSREPVEDLRIDFEDGYGQHPEAEELTHAQRAGAAWRAAEDAGALPAFCGLRLKPLTEATGQRALATLDTFLSAAQPRRQVLVTLPKVETPAQVRFAVEALERAEGKHGLSPGTLRLEVMIESAQGLQDGEGRSLLPQLHAAAGGRLFAAHFGAYDFLSSLGIAAHEQRLTHPACDFARLQMKLAFSETGVFLSDGATIHLPVGPHRGEALSHEQREENRRAVHAAWQTSMRDVRHSLAQGYYQGWDLHPAQLVPRYGALFAFFLENEPSMRARLESFQAAQARATLTGSTFDDAASVRGLLHFFERGRACGALTPD